MTKFVSYSDAGTLFDQLDLPIQSRVKYVYDSGFLFEWRLYEPGYVFRAFGLSTPSVSQSFSYHHSADLYPAPIIWQFTDFTVERYKLVNAAESGAPSQLFELILQGDDDLLGGQGDDQLYGLTGNDTIQGGAGNDSISEGSGANYLRGNEGDDVVRGGEHFDDINGNMGNDTLNGLVGDDWVVGGKDNDVVYGDLGNDIVYGNMGDDMCAGGEGDDIVRGGQGNDMVRGDAGNDWIAGDRGNDTMTGGTGEDVFHFFVEAGHDAITDFHFGEDRIQLPTGTSWTLKSAANGDAMIELSTGETLTLQGIQLGIFPPGWIFEA